ncbi:MAG TPA: hypothetical protein VFG64_01235 [Dongiaceae bacterium]|nr:hypothetical protein [Dongiaceae bacterium]
MSRSFLGLGRFASIVCSLILLSASPADAWQSSHADSVNSNSVDVRTARAVKPMATVLLRDIAPGVNPVIAPDGTLYIGDRRGKLMAFRPDGTLAWSREIGGFQSIMSSPAIGSDGSVYVVGTATIRDHRTNPPATSYVAELHRFTAGGGWLWHVPIAGPHQGIVVSAPTVIQHGGSDIVLVATGRQHDGFEAYVTAFSSGGGAVLAHHKASVFESPQVSGGADLDWSDLWDWLYPGFSVTIDAVEEYEKLPRGLSRPFPAPAVYMQAEDGIPRIYLTDRFHDLVGLGFTGTTFSELFRIRDNHRYFTTAALVWPNGPVMAGGFYSEDAMEMTFLSIAPSYTGGPVTVHRIAMPAFVTTPASLGNSRYAVVLYNGGVSFLRGAAVEKQVDLTGQSIASAAASRGHVFVSTVTGLYTFDKTTMKKVAEFGWAGGGVSQPVIGPRGHVYAIAQDTLYVFPPSRIPDMPNPGPLPEITGPGALPRPGVGGSGTTNPGPAPQL